MEGADISTNDHAQRIFDCFPFFMELDLLDLRLRELGDLVHRFVLVENAWDFAGNPKPLHFAENRDRFAEFHDRIVHVVVEDKPGNAEARWAIQRHQRDHILTGLDAARPDDIVMISDVDEIPRRTSVEHLRETLAHRRMFATFLMDHHVYRLNLRPEPVGQITGTRAVRRRDLRVPHLVRQLKRRYWKSAPDWADQIPARFNAVAATGLPLPRLTLPDAGWHMHSVGGRDLLRAKWRSFVVDETLDGQTSWDDRFGEALDRGEIAEKLGLSRVVAADLPVQISRAPDRYAHLIA
ncbi:MAG: hypothetical protein AAFP68_16435 [Pseudomonadota bacterium]